MYDEVFAVSKFFYVYFRGGGGVCVFTPPQNRGGVIFLLQFVCLCVCVSVCLSVCEQNADRTATPILTRSSLNSCLLQSLKPY